MKIAQQVSAECITTIDVNVKRNQMENNQPQEVNAHVFVPQQLLQLLTNLMSPLMCCPGKRGINQERVFFMDNKTYCEDCFKKVAEEIQNKVVEEPSEADKIKMGEAALHQ